MLPAESLGCDEPQPLSRNTSDFNQPPCRPSYRISLCHTAQKHLDALTATKMQPLSSLILFFLFLNRFFEGPAKGPEFTADTIGQFCFLYLPLRPRLFPALVLSATLLAGLLSLLR